MGQALLNGWLGRGIGPVTVVEPNPSAAIRGLARKRRVRLHADIEETGAATYAACVIAIKPQILKTEAVRLKQIGDNGALLISIAAGTSIKTLAKACGARARIIRAMPNLPGAIGKGISALYPARRVTAADRKTATELLSALGEVVWVPRESMIDTVTAVSGSGPAYVFLMAEALARAAAKEGLPPKLAEQFARATIVGAGALLDAGDQTPGELRTAVTSPKGTTEAALGVLMGSDALADLVGRAVAAARKRAIELQG